MSGKNPLGSTKEAQAYEGVNVIVPVGGWRLVRSTRNPTSNDIKYPIGSMWINTSNNTAWLLTSNPGTWSEFAASVPGAIISIVNQASGSASLAAQTMYITNNGASLVTYTLPATVAQGTTIKIVGLSAGGWRIAQNANQTINLGSQVTTTGTGGSVSSSNKFNCVELVATDATTNVWVITNATGALTFV